MKMSQTFLARQRSIGSELWEPLCFGQHYKTPNQILFPASQESLLSPILS